MRSRQVIAAVSSALLGAACVDLFHSTDFVTLCQADASACVEDAAIGIPDADLPDTGQPLDFCGWSSAEALQHARRACGWVGACHGVIQGSSFASCMTRALAAYDCALNPTLRPVGNTRTLWTCLADVTSCTEVNRCLFEADTAPSCGPVASGTFRACNNLGPPGSSVIECGLPGQVNPPVGLESCVLEGRSCVAIDVTRSVCAGFEGAECVGFPRCAGSFAVSCQEPTIRSPDLGLDCASVGSGSCVEDDAGVACRPIADAGVCSGSSRVTCDDAGVARSCVDGREITVDCTVLGETCAVSGVPATAPMTACRPATACTAGDSCAGDLLRSCANGRSFELACSTLGLGPCALPPATRGQFAACTK